MQTTTAMTVEQKVYQMFILGYEEENPSANAGFMRALASGLGGVIFFTRNILDKERFKDTVKVIKTNSLYSPFLSIDQEGGRVERTLNLYGGSHYLSARAATKKGTDFVRQQTQWICEELNYFGLNMNFAPVLDVDTNPNNPVIADRAYSNDPDEVIRYGKIVIDTFKQNNIIPVGKHFPGHGETKVDSHLDMPVLDMSMQELEQVHVKPFKELAPCLPAIMAAHIHYKAFDKEKIPASISKNVLNYLRTSIGFNGIIISDDMVMGGVKRFSAFDACKKGIMAGINMFIYRNADEKTLSLIEQIIKAVKNGEIPQSKIDESVNLITNLKELYKT